MTTAAQQLCLMANRLGRKYGVHGEPYYFNKEEVTHADMADNRWLVKAFTEFGKAFYGRTPYLQITRTSKVDWVIFYGEQPGIGLANKGEVGTLVPVSEASIEAKQLALRHSKELFSRYLKQVKTAVSGIDADLIAASKTIEELANL